jgi:hypothetical protein
MPQAISLIGYPNKANTVLKLPSLISCVYKKDVNPASTNPLTVSLSPVKKNGIENKKHTPSCR